MRKRSPRTDHIGKYSHISETGEDIVRKGTHAGTSVTWLLHKKLFSKQILSLRCKRMWKEGPYGVDQRAQTEYGSCNYYKLIMVFSLLIIKGSVLPMAPQLSSDQISFMKLSSLTPELCCTQWTYLGWLGSIKFATQ